MSSASEYPVVWLCVFFQAEDGIRDYKVTGVQTCALPIYVGFYDWERMGAGKGCLQRIDRKSTRLNSSHLVISYAVFCLNKKTEHRWGRSAVAPPARRGRRTRTQRAP